MPARRRKSKAKDGASAASPTVAQLQELLSANGLSAKGKKQALADRWAAFQSSGASPSLTAPASSGGSVTDGDTDYDTQDEKVRTKRESNGKKSASAPAEGMHFGYTKSGEQFTVPPTVNTISAFYPKNWNAVSLLTMALVLFHSYFVITEAWPVEYHVAWFIFWRVCYNIGLGLLLRQQSMNNSFTNFYAALVANKIVGGSIKRLARSGYSDTMYKYRFPVEFEAWIMFKHFVTLVLVNDGCAYVLLGYKCFIMPLADEVDAWLLGRYAVGLMLAAFNYWAKVDAHRCIGTYCWYYGDFFFRKDQNLTFDGIFNLFPHPMYTVGYSLYYGFSLITRSYTVLYVSLAAHFMQLCFLVFVEEPHIKRLYGGEEELDNKVQTILYDDKHGLFPHKKDLLTFFRFDFRRFSDVALLVACVYSVLFALTVENREWCVVQVVVWAAVHWGGIGYLLYAQSTRSFYTNYFVNQGRPLYEAFSNWKAMYNFSVTINAVVFVACAARYLPVDVTDLARVSEYVLNQWNVMCIVMGMVMAAISAWTSVSIYHVTGEFGWFYGDFFISDVPEVQHLQYTGIYRFLNNPECVTGYLGMYGMALMLQSMPVLGLAALSHGLNIGFLVLVEAPHVNRLYKNAVRKDGPIRTEFKNRRRELLKGLRAMRRRRFSSRAMANTSDEGSS
jgi:phosphatidylethanolamine N-methyltransferase